MLQPLQAPLKLLISYYQWCNSQEVTHSVPPTNHSACFPRPVHSNKSWFPHPDSLRQPPPASYQHVIYCVTPAKPNQVTCCLLPIEVFPLPQATFTFRVPGRNAFAFHVPS
ncbi:hypothetical protein TNCV_1623441 [Trichonephila clavipes]|nr:hypothetical protein TNCV_1623441 [Trichonephila clavipes]